MKPSILLLGSQGQLGQEWMQFLKVQEVKILMPPLDTLDITDKDSVIGYLDTYKPHIIINCAAYTQVDHAEKNISQCFNTNTLALVYITQWCQKHEDTLLIHYSTDYVYRGLMEDKKKLPNGYPENAYIQPANIYGLSKYWGEQAITMSKCKAMIIRLSWLCGKYGSNFLYTILTKAKSTKTLHIVNDQWGVPTFTENVVYNTWEMIKNENIGIYNLSSDGSTTWYTLSCTFFEYLNIKDITIHPISSLDMAIKIPNMAKRPYYSVLNMDKIKKINNVNIWHWKDGLKHFVNSIDIEPN